jgi:hypothetical protein
MADGGYVMLSLYFDREEEAAAARELVGAVLRV